MPDTSEPARLFDRLRSLPWLRITGGFLLVLVVVGVVPPLRNAAALGASKVILFVASPLAPPIADLSKLPETSRVLAADGSVLAELDKSERREPIEVEALPAHVKQAVLAAEDTAFYEHSGINPTGLFRAMVRSAQGRIQGGSTITQQVAKINYTARERTLMRKLKEVLYASRLEKKYTKDEILERYLNQIYFGEGAYGINAAAQTMFGVTADQLTPDQAAVLAGKIRSPEGLNPRKDPGRMTERRDQVLAEMLDQGWLDAAAHDQAKSRPLELVPPRPPDSSRTPHFLEYVKREARTLDALGTDEESRSTQLFTGGYTIETTLDPKTFDAATRSVQERLGAPEDPVTAIAVIQPGDGAIRTLFGGLDFATTQFDMSSLGGRDAGSSFKPFVYLSALRKGIDPRNRYDGTSGREIPCYGQPVNNYAGEDAGGEINVDEAMVKSVNVVFVELGCAVGVPEVERTAVGAGVPDDAVNADAAKGAVFLGSLGAGVNALDMASSFATFAARGVYAEPYSIARIKAADGRVVYEHKVEARPVFKPEEVGVLNNPLQGVVREGTGRGATIERPVAGKTGTTQNNIDAWFVGYTPQLATAVWIGFPDASKPMNNVRGRAVTGGSFPTQIFADVMRRAHEGMPVQPLFTASPDALGIAPTTTTLPPPPPTSSTTTAPSTTTTSTTAPTSTTTTTRPSTTTTPQSTTTTTTTVRSSTTTTVRAGSASGGAQPATVGTP